MNQIKRIVLGTSLLTLLLAGCDETSKPVAREQFFTPEDNTNVQRQVMNRQASTGAAYDATLYDFHFDGGKLNSTGEAKVDRILANGGASKKIYIDMTGDTAAIESAVADYLVASGLTTDQFAVQKGANPGISAPAGAGLKGLDRQRDSGEASTDTAGVDK